MRCGMHVALEEEPLECPWCEIASLRRRLAAMTSRYTRAAGDIASLEDELAKAREDKWLIAQAVGIKKDEVYCTQSIVDRIAEARESTGRLEVKLFERESTNRKLEAENAALRELLAQAADPCNELFEEWYEATNALLERIGE